MELNTILTLINAGYSKAEIEAMTGEQGAEQQNGQGAEQQNGQGAEQPKEAVPFSTKDVEDFTALSKAIAELTETVKGLQSQNAKRAESAPPEKTGAEGAIKGFFGVK